MSPQTDTNRAPEGGRSTTRTQTGERAEAAVRSAERGAERRTGRAGRRTMAREQSLTALDAADAVLRRAAREGRPVRVTLVGLPDGTLHAERPVAGEP